MQHLPLLADVARVLKFAPFTVTAIDTALYDLAGRALGVPVSTLLGGAFRDRVAVHVSVGWDEDPAAMADLAVEQAATYDRLAIPCPYGGQVSRTDCLPPRPKPGS